MLLNKKIIFIVIIFILTGVSYGGYLWWDSQRTDTLVFSVIKNGTSELFINMVKSESLDRKNRLNIVTKVASSAVETDRQFLSREGVDAAPVGAIAVANYNLEGSDGRIIAPFLLAHFAILVRNDSPYQTIEDLKDKKFASRTKTTTIHQALAIILKKKGIDLENYFQLVYPASIAESAAVLESGEVEASMVPEPEASRLVATGKFRELLFPESLWEEMTGEPFGGAFVVVHQDWLKKNTRTATKLLRTISDGQDYIYNEPEEFVAKYKIPLGIKTDKEEKLFQERMLRIFPSSWDDRAISNVNSQLNIAVELGIISKLPKENIVVKLGEFKH